MNILSLDTVASHRHIMGPHGALWSTVHMLSVELYSNFHMLNPRMASHTVFSYFNDDAILLVV